MIIHPIQPIFDEHSKILILGSFPSQKSREEKFFYGHPQNRFWKVLAAVFEQEVPKTICEKTQLLLSNQIALWDVIASCDVTGSSDQSIKNAVANDLQVILSAARIRRIFVNGKAAEKYYKLYMRPAVGRDAVYLPSTSPANAAWSLEKLISAWKTVKMLDVDSLL